MCCRCCCCKCHGCSCRKPCGPNYYPSWTYGQTQGTANPGPITWQQTTGGSSGK